MTIADIRASKAPVYVYVLADGREYQGEVRGKNRDIPFVSYDTNEGFFRREFTWSAIERAVNHGEVLYG